MLDNVRDAIFPIRRFGVPNLVAGETRDVSDLGGDGRVITISESNAFGATWGNLLIRLGRQGDWLPVARGVTIKTSGFSQIAFRNIGGSTINLTCLISNDPEFNFTFLDTQGTVTAVS